MRVAAAARPDVVFDAVFSTYPFVNIPPDTTILAFATPEGRIMIAAESYAATNVGAALGVAVGDQVVVRAGSPPRRRQVKIPEGLLLRK